MPFSVSCDACGAAFKLPDEIYERRVAGRVVSLVCKKCKKPILVDGTKPRSQPPGPQVVEAPGAASPAPGAGRIAPAASAPEPKPAPVAVPEAPRVVAPARMSIPSEVGDWDIPSNSVLPPPKVSGRIEPALAIPAAASTPAGLPTAPVAAEMPPAPTAAPSPAAPVTPPAPAAVASPATPATPPASAVLASSAAPITPAAPAAVASPALPPVSPAASVAKSEPEPVVSSAKAASNGRIVPTAAKPELPRSLVSSGAKPKTPLAAVAARPESAAAETPRAADAQAKAETEPSAQARPRLQSVPKVAEKKVAEKPKLPGAAAQASAQAQRAKPEAQSGVQTATLPRAKPEPLAQPQRPKQEPLLGREARAKADVSAQPQPRAKVESAPQVQPRAKIESSPQATAKAKQEPAAQTKAKPAGAKEVAKPAAAARPPPTKPARSPRPMPAALPVEIADDAMTVPLPPVAEESPTRPLPPVISRAPTLPGTGPAARPAAAAAAPEPPANLWAVSYADDDDRELTTEELIRELQAGALDAETLVWRQTMPDWCALGDVPELAAHLPKGAASTSSATGFQVAEPERGQLYATAYYPPPPEDDEEEDKTAVFAYDAALLAAAAAEPTLPPAQPTPVVQASQQAQRPPVLPITSGGPPPLISGGAAPIVSGGPPPLTSAAQRPFISGGPPPIPSARISTPGAMPAQDARGASPSIPPKFRRKRGGLLAIVLLAVIGGLAGIVWLLARGLDSSRGVAPVPDRKVQTPRTGILPSDKSEETAEKKEPIDPYAVPGSASATPSSSSRGDFFELFASGAQNSQPGSQAFDKPLAEKALTALAARAANCRKTGEPPGMISLIVRFEPNGLISDVRVVGKPYEDTATAHCVASRFLGARVQAFKGEPQTLVKNFMLY